MSVEDVGQTSVTEYLSPQTRDSFLGNCAMAGSRSRAPKASEKEELRFPTCPSCKSDNVVPIFYGYYPNLPPELMRSGKFDLGGCEVSTDDPDWHCKDCDNRWRGGEKTVSSGWTIDVDSRTVRLRSANR